MVQSATRFGRSARIALAAGAVLGAAAFGATAAVAHERGYYVEAPAYYVPAPVYYAPPPPVYYAPQPAYGNVLEFMFSFGDNDRGGYRDHHDNGRHVGWDRGRGHGRGRD